MAALLERPRTQWTGKKAAWRELEDHQQAMRGRHLWTLFAVDPARSERMTAEAAGVFLDYSQNRIDDETLRLLIERAQQSGLRVRIEAMRGRHRSFDHDCDRSQSLPSHTGRIPCNGRAFPHRAVCGQPAPLMGLLAVWYNNFFGAQTAPCCRMSRGYDRALSASFQAKMFGRRSSFSEAQTAEISRAKRSPTTDLTPP
jgi:hypothetical protein